MNVTMMNLVWLNKTTPCKVIAVKGNSLTCIVPATRAGIYVVDLEVNGGGATSPHGIATQPVGGPLTVVYPLVIRSLSPQLGSAAGGTLITLSGVGFNPDGSDVVLVGGRPCAVSSVSFNELVCAVPPPGSAWDGSTIASGSLMASVVVNGMLCPSQFTYSASITPTVTAVTPRTLSSGLSGTINITVANLAPGTPASTMDIAFGSRSCVAPFIVSTTAGSTAATLSGLPISVNGACGATAGTRCPPGACCSQYGYCGTEASHCTNCQTAYGYCPITAIVSCRLVRNTAPPLPQAPISPVVYVSGIGNANASGVALDVSLYVRATSRSSGSLLGGTVVNFTGAG